MNIGVIGTGRVAQTLGLGWARVGHEVTYGSRKPGSEDASKAAGASGRVVGVAEAAAWADIVVLAVPWKGLRASVESLGDLGGKVLIDATNPVVFGSLEFETPRDLGFGSGGEAVQAWTTGARVVKAFNTTGAANLANPVLAPGIAAPIFLCGADDAKGPVRELAAGLGFEVFDLGGLDMSRLTEAAAELWITLAYTRGLGPDFILGVVRRPA